MNIALPLAFKGVTNCLLTRITDGTAKIPITPRLFPVPANHHQVRADEKLGMVLCLIIHDERALTLVIWSNLGIGFKATFLPESSIKIA